MTPIKPLADVADNYEIIELLEPTVINDKEVRYFYKCRKKYGGGIASSLRGGIFEAARNEIASQRQLGEGNGALIVDPMAQQWVEDNLYELDYSKPIPKMVEKKKWVGKGDKKKEVVVLDVNEKPVMVQDVYPDGTPFYQYDYKLRAVLPEAILKVILRILCTPLANAPDVLSAYDDITEEAIAKVKDFFTICITKPEKTSLKKPESIESSAKDGEAEKES